MSIIIKTNAMKYKDNNGDYQGFNAIAQESTDQQIAAIVNAGQNQIEAIAQSGADVLDSIPNDYTQMETDVANLKSQITSIDAGDVAFDDQQAYNDGTVGAGLTNLKSQIGAVDSMALGAYPTDTASGAVASLSDGSDNLPVKDLVIGIEPVQSGSGDPSPDNVRPISGWTGAKVAVAGINIWDEETEFGQWSDNRHIWVASASQLKSKNYIPIKPVTTYRLVNPQGTISRYVFYDANKNYMSWTSANSNSNFTTPANSAYMMFGLATMYGTTYNHNISINYPATDNTYHPYVGTTYPITFPSEAGTVYGGTLDVNTGVLTVDRFNIDPANWTQYAQGNGYAAYKITEMPYGIGGYVDSKPISNIVSKFGSFSSSSMSENIIQPPTSNSTIAYLALQDDLSASNVQLSYKIKTPQTYQLTPVEVLTLLGANRIYADTGDVLSLTYRADPTLYIQRINTPTDDDMTADAQIASGKYFVIGNTLYKATTTIPAGDTINPGTNCVITNLVEALNALNA